MPHKFTSLRHPVEKLLEAEHFLGRLAVSNGLKFQFELNAFLSASRSVTFVLQKAMFDVPGFADWYAQRQDQMKAHLCHAFFLGAKKHLAEARAGFLHWRRSSERWLDLPFRRPTAEVPEELVGHDIGACCAAHLMKLAILLRECDQAFPYYSCPGRAFTERGMAALGYTWRDVETSLGLPAGYTDVGDIPVAEKLRILSREIEPLDLTSIERIAAGDLEVDGTQIRFLNTDGNDLVDGIAAIMASEGLHARSAFLSAISKRLSDEEDE